MLRSTYSTTEYRLTRSILEAPNSPFRFNWNPNGAIHGVFAWCKLTTKFEQAAKVRIQAPNSEKV